MPMIDTSTMRFTPASVPTSCRLRVAVVKKCVASSWSGEGPVAPSMIASTPSSASARPSPVITSTPFERAIGTTSLPCASMVSTSGRPRRPVAPVTAIFVIGGSSCHIHRVWWFISLTPHDQGM
jgi:hypothetical protein